MTVRSGGAKRLLKRWARRALAHGSVAAGIGRGGRLTPGLRILTYHRVADDPADPFAVPPGDFGAQMEAVAATGVVRPLEEALEEIERGEDGRPMIALTFDDGTTDFLTEALPVLARLGLPATLYVSPARIGEMGFLEWEDLRRVGAAGIRVGAHGLDHRSLGRIAPAEVWPQVSGSRRQLEERLGVGVTTMSYPFGTVRDFNAGVKEAVRRAGYRSACTSVNGVNRSSTDPMELRRTKIEQGDGPIFERILLGGLDGWAVVDRHLAAIQNRYA